MSPSVAVAPRTRPDPLYTALAERILDRDQVGASEVYYGLVKAGRPLPEMLREGVRIHAPYTHVPYHERIDDGYPNFVNNDHCLLSARATINLAKMLPERLRCCRWRRPSGTSRAASISGTRRSTRRPGHYTRARQSRPIEAPPAPVVYWPDQEPLRQDGPLKERLNNWMTLVHRGQVLDAYRVFLGLMEDRAEPQGGAGRTGVRRADRRAGPDAVQPLLHDRPQGVSRALHGGDRQRDRLGQCAHHVLYAGALDIAVGPRWYSTYEMACNLVKMNIEGEALHAVPYGGVSDAELAVLRNNKEPLNQEEAAGADRGDASAARARQPEHHDRAAEGRQGPAAHPRRDADRPRAQVVMETSGRTTSRCRITATSTATRWRGSTTSSTIRAGCG